MLVFPQPTDNSFSRSYDYATVDEIADECFVPLSVGGGVATIEEARRLLQVGADKIVVNTAAVEKSDIVSAIAAEFGSQCAVVSIDAKQKPDGTYEVYTHSGTKATGLDVVTFALKMAAAGAGEIVLTSIDRDGTMEGYDIPLIKSVTSVVNIPVIASGGAGSYQHMAEAILEGGASAVSAASIFHFTECTPLEAKRYLKEKGISVRL
jgi:cyclase